MNSIFKPGQIFALSDAESVLKTGQGGNVRNVLVVLGATVEQAHLELLRKILEAVQIDLEKDIFLIRSTSDTRFSFAEADRQLQSVVVLSFGFPLEQMSLHFRLAPYQPHRIQGKVFLLADTLAEISQKRVLKQKLWEALQAIFLS